jgi:dolichol-phosphate mannosyltransferase
VDEFLARVQAAAPSADIYFVDDNSPDGTGDLVAERAKQDDRVRLITRNGERGYAAASREGLSTIAERGYDAIVTIDCDLSHDPNVIPTMLDQLASGTDVVIGSRYIAGGGVRNWSLSRRLLSRWGNLYTSFMLGIKVRDCTSGFRTYGHKVITSGVIPSTTSNGYAFLSEVLMKLHATRHCRVVEVPIVYVDRISGQSKMNKTIISESMRLVTKWGLSRLSRRA